MDLIDRLETYRLENKITQQELAAKLGVAFSTINRWLNRHVKPNKIQSYQIQKLIGEGASRGKRKK
jgi:transcriptional regulator with XRE-family HTH domain